MDSQTQLHFEYSFLQNRKFHLYCFSSDTSHILHIVTRFKCRSVDNYIALSLILHFIPVSKPTILKICYVNWGNNCLSHDLLAPNDVFDSCLKLE